MKIQYASDLHLEFEPERTSFDDILKNSEKSDYLVLCGDIGTPTEIPVLRRFLIFCSANWAKVFYIPGNHEYYYYEFHTANQILENLCKECNVEFSLFKTHRISNNLSKDVIMIMTTLWSNIPEEYDELIASKMTDYSIIAYNKNNVIEKFTPRISSSIHMEQKLHLYNTIDSIRNNDNANFVIFTHHAPLMIGTSSPRFEGNPTNFAFATDCSIIFDKDIIAWVYGHTHYNNTFNFGNTLIVNNQRGYKGNCKNYSTEKYLSLP